MRLFKTTPNIPFVPLRFVFISISLFFIVIGGYSLFTRGLNYGIDFLGGVKLQYHFSEPISENDVRKALEDSELGPISVIRLGEEAENRLLIKLAQTGNEGFTFSHIITPKLEKAFNKAQITLEREETVGPKVGKELRRKGILAVLFSMVCMLIYIGFRFNFQFAPGAILALLHDVCIMMGILSILQVEFNLTILAGILTLVGYSVNDTIIVFDRVREHSRLINHETVKDIMNQSLNETFSRTIITSLTTFVVVAALYALGGVTIKDFALCLMLGIIIGTFSTFSVAGPSYIALYQAWPKLEKLFGGKGT